MHRYGVSRATVRQALGGLIAAGALEVRRGLGTFVASARFEHTIGGFYSFSREIERHGLTPGTRVLELRTEAATADIAQALAIPPGTELVALRRLRLAGPDPLVVETSHLPAARFPRARNRRLQPGPAVRHVADSDIAAARPGHASRSSRSCSLPTKHRSSTSTRDSRRCGLSGSHSTRTTSRSNSVEARFEATAIATRSSCATDDDL
jgi:hypothetical protein